jgi:hypothetical protein
MGESKLLSLFFHELRLAHAAKKVVVFTSSQVDDVP